MPQQNQLPNGLLIILHLHLLDYPLHDATGYDERLFDPTRGMRERNKAMEDISYFLVAKIERSKERAKSILPTYPCLQPSDTTAYKIALAKYLEAIRNSVAHTTHAGDRQPEQKGKQPACPAKDEASAWWWKDVVVRKSILDECCGERFERLILALSSHAVLKNTTRVPPTLQRPLSEEDHAILGTLSKAYTPRLAAAQSERLEWERSAALLIQRHADLTVIRARLETPRHASSSKYDSLETARLLALRDLRHQDLLRGPWRGDEGQRSLQLVTSLVGLLDPESSSDSAPALPHQERGAPSSSHLDRPQIPPSTEPPPPLPIAAARHPSQLHALAEPLFPESRPLETSIERQTAGSAPPHAIAERLAAIENVQKSLSEALLAAQSIRAQLQRRLEKAQVREPAPARSRGGPKDKSLKLDISLWERRTGPGVEFKSPEAAASLLAQFGFASPLPENAIEEQISPSPRCLVSPSPLRAHKHRTQQVGQMGEGPRANQTSSMAERNHPRRSGSQIVPLITPIQNLG
ncbi:hypothetical protein C8Q70DRAFT_234350 [Cubamyces menziesii]|nr:hypothetical protein C8Q70DRAFT_234350 [Cubamyces menziesii]